MDEETLIKALRDHVTYLRETERAFYKAQAAGNLTAQLAEQLNDARKTVCSAAKDMFPTAQAVSKAEGIPFIAFSMDEADGLFKRINEQLGTNLKP